MAPLIHQLSIGRAFDGLSEREKLYAHHLSRAAWHGARIILRQVSPEATGIFDFIIALYSVCGGDWDQLGAQTDVSKREVEGFLDYAANFLSNVGNYYGSGDRKFTPRISQESLAKLASVSNQTSRLFEEIREPLFSKTPISLGFPSDVAQSAYYPEDGGILSREEVARVSQLMEGNFTFPENTRIRKQKKTNGSTSYEVLQASVDHDDEGPSRLFHLPETGEVVHLIRGDHSAELLKICEALTEGAKYSANPRQEKFLREYVESFRTGDLELYRESQRTWVKDRAPRIENIFGFVEPYRDPFGIRAEFEGLVAISNAEETRILARLAAESTTFIRKLPWAYGCEDNDGKGPFEKELFEPPDFTSIHSLAYCSSIIFSGINLPNYNDIRQEVGFKNVVIANRMAAEASTAKPHLFVDEAEYEQFQKHKFATYYLWVVLHELLGHGTGKMMRQDADDCFNFDPTDPPINPLTGRPITHWYGPGQTWTGVFGELATTVDECRAELVGAYLMDDIELLKLFGYTEESEITADDLTYNMYLQLGVDGLRGLANFNFEDKKWGQAHSRAHFAILKHLLRDGNGFMRVERDPKTKKLTVHVDRSRILQDGKPALGQMLLKLHMYRCTADIEGCRAYYEDLSKVDGEYLEWRSIVLSCSEPKWLFSQANTFLEDGVVRLAEYDPTTRGVIKSWAERNV